MAMEETCSPETTMRGDGEPLASLSSTNMAIVFDKECRRDLDQILQKLHGEKPSRERALAITKVQECIMWLGMDLKRLNDGRTCYPESYNPENTVVHPTSDGVKL